MTDAIVAGTFDTKGEDLDYVVLASEMEDRFGKEFQLAFNIDGDSFNINLPVAQPSSAVEGFVQQPETLITQLSAINQALAQTVDLPPEFDRPGLNFSIAALPRPYSVSASAMWWAVGCSGRSSPNTNRLFCWMIRRPTASAATGSVLTIRPPYGQV